MKKIALISMIFFALIAAQVLAVEVPPQWSTNVSSTPSTFNPATLSEFNISWDGAATNTTIIGAIIFIGAFAVAVWLVLTWLFKW